MLFALKVNAFTGSNKVADSNGLFAHVVKMSCFCVGWRPVKKFKDLKIIMFYIHIRHRRDIRNVFQAKLRYIYLKFNCFKFAF